MVRFATGLFGADFLPHGWCYRWDATVVFLHVGSDLLIALAYYFIPFALIYIVRRRSDLIYPWMFWLFGLFILACGTTHLMNVLTVWYPWYRLDGLIKLITALSSVPTAIALIRIAPAVINLPGPEKLRLLNAQLAQEVVDRRAAEETARKLAEDLERRVHQRTAELEHANRRLRESEERTRAILDSSPALVYVKDTFGRYQFVNREFEQTFRKSRDTVVQKTDFDLFPRTTAEAYSSADQTVLAARVPQQFEETVFPSGQARTYMSMKFPLQDESGKTYALCGISTDITERKKAEQALRQYNKELEQLAYVAAHDLQEPLRTVKAYSQLLIRRYRKSLDETAEEIVGFITTGVDRMEALIQDLRLYTELTGPALAVPVDANEVLRDTTRSLDYLIRNSSALIDAEPLTRVYVSPVRLSQVFQNLISNAIKYRGQRRPEIHIYCVPGQHETEFVVADNGIGIDMAYAEQIFGVFRRLHGWNIPGTGIGLAICKRVVELYGGRIWVVSEPGKGSEFHFTLPSPSPAEADSGS